MQKRLSVIIPNHNGGEFIRACLKSVTSQTYTNIEIIFIDDASTDNSMNIVAEYKDAKITVIKNDTRKGVSFCRNAGIEKSTGEYIGFVDSDDYVASDWAELIITKLEKNSLAFCRGWMQTVTNNQYTSSTYRFGKTNEQIREEIWFHGASIIGGIITKKDLGILRFKEDLKKNEDTFLFLHILEEGCRVGGIKKRLYFYRRHINNVTSSPLILSNKDIIALQYIKDAKIRISKIKLFKKNNICLPLTDITIYNSLLTMVYGIYSLKGLSKFSLIKFCLFSLYLKWRRKKD